MTETSTTHREVGKTRNPWGVWLLAIVTLGIYGLWWYYDINREVRDYDEAIEVEPIVSLVAIIFGVFTLYIATIVSIFRTGERIAQAQRAAGAEDRCSGLIGVLLYFFIFGTGIVYYQSQLNKVWDQHGNPRWGALSTN